MIGEQLFSNLLSDPFKPYTMIALCGLGRRCCEDDLLPILQYVRNTLKCNLNRERHTHTFVNPSPKAHRLTLRRSERANGCEEPVLKEL